MYFATLLDRNYISRAALMISSLKYYAGEALQLVYVLCLDDDVQNYFLGIDRVKTIKLNLIEDYFPELKSIKSNRSYVEYIFTLSPFLPLYVLEVYPTVQRVTTLDSDIYFLANPAQAIGKLGDSKIGITPHDFSNDLKSKEMYGLYNVCFQSFPASDEGFACLRKWANECVDYCGDHIDELGRFADQKYLDSWSSSFPSVEAFETPYIGLAPWNIKKYDIEWIKKSLTCNNKKIVCYHFHHFRIKSQYHVLHGLDLYQYEKPSNRVLKLYVRYWQSLKKISASSDKGITRYNSAVTFSLSTIVKEMRTSQILFKLGFLVLNLDLRNFIKKISSLKNKLYGTINLT